MTTPLPPSNPDSLEVVNHTLSKRIDALEERLNMVISALNSAHIDISKVPTESSKWLLTVTSETPLKEIEQNKKQHKDDIVARIKRNAFALKDADPSEKKDKDVVLAAVKQDGEALQFADSSLKKDKDFVLAAVQENGHALEYADSSLKNDKEFVLAVIKIHGFALRYADSLLKKDKGFVLAAVVKNVEALEYADSSLKKDKDFVLAAVKKKGTALRYADSLLKKDKGVVLAAVNQDGRALYSVDSSLNKDKDIVLAAVKQNGTTLPSAHSSLKKDEDVVLAAVKQDGDVLYYADSSLKKDKDIVLAAVKQKGAAFYYADSSLKKDKDFVLAVVKNRGYTLQYADSSLKKDKDVVLAAVNQDGDALYYADASLKKDKDIVLAAVQQKGYALEYADLSLKNDPDLLLLANKSQTPKTYSSNNDTLVSLFTLSTDSPGIEMPSTGSSVSSWVKASSSSSSIFSPSSVLMNPIDKEVQQTSDIDAKEEINLNLSKKQPLSDSEIHDPYCSTILTTPLSTGPDRKSIPVVRSAGQATEAIYQPIPVHPSIVRAGHNNTLSPQVEKIKQELLRQERKGYPSASFASTDSSSSILDTHKDVTQQVEKHRADIKRQQREEGRHLLNRYIHEHKDELKDGAWISIINGDYTTASHFATYQEAATVHEQHTYWYCKEYHGPDISTAERVHIVRANFGDRVNGRHPKYAYIFASVSNPLNSSIPAHRVQMMMYMFYKIQKKFIFV